MRIRPLFMIEIQEKESNLKKKKQFKKNILFGRRIEYRIHFFAMMIFLSMFLILIQAYVIQIVRADYYAIKLFNQTSKRNSISTLRGVIYDRNYEILVGNKQRINLILKKTSQTDLDILSKKIISTFEIETSNMTTDELKQAYIFFLNKEKSGASQSVSNLETNYEEVSDKQINQITEYQKKYFIIYQLLENENHIIKENLTKQEVAIFLEHQFEFENLSLEFDWDREYDDKFQLRSLLGKVSRSSFGIHKENLLEYLAKGYHQNDKIGVSGLENVYEDLLKGRSFVSSITMDDSGNLVNKVEDEGERGYDLTLALDMNLQVKVEEITQTILEREKENPKRSYFDQIVVVVMNPNNGDVLCMVSMNQTKEGTYYNDASQTYVQSFIPGSVVKGATLYMGLDQGVININEVLIDEPLKLASSPSKASWKNLGAINDIQALALSSNVYMMKIALRLAGTNYVYNGGLSVKKGTFDTMRSYYQSFGLGVLTQADVYNEQIGYIGNDRKDGNILDYAIGQYDTYTALELAQYVSTVANGGKRLKPRIMLEATLPSKKNVVYTNEVTILNILENKEAMERVQQGFRACVVSGLCTSLKDAPVQIAAKTGTAEAYWEMSDEDGTSYMVSSPNNSVVAYAPYENPQLAIACVIPHAWNGKNSQSNLCLEVTNEIVNYVFKE